jgi:hypothetical protein
MSELSVDLQQDDIGIIGLYPNAILSDEQSPDASLEVTMATLSESPRHRCVRATVKNTGKSPVKLKGIRWGYRLAWIKPKGLCFPSNLGPTLWCHENFRGDWIDVGSTEGDSYAQPLTNQSIEIGRSEDSVFPGFFVGAKTAPLGLLVAQASQTTFRCVFTFRGKIMDQDRWAMTIEEIGGNGIDVTLAPGAMLQGEAIWIGLCNTNDPQYATEDYYAYLKSAGAFDRRAINPLADQRIYCSWNYDFFENIDQDKMLGQIPALKKHFPQVKFLQLDDGYQLEHRPGQRKMIDFLWGEPKHGFDPARFPDGPRAFCDKVRAAGYRPAIWIGLWASIGCPMLQANPDWLLRDDTGRAIEFPDGYGGVCILDYSVPGVQKYIDHVAKTVFGEWGFEGLKLDFCSFAFNGRYVRLRDRTATQIQLRDRVIGAFRKYLPRDGFFGWCVVCGTGSPLLSQADYYRNAIDIAHGDWKNARRIAAWTANTNLFNTHRASLPNLDSIGWSKQFDETAWRSWLNLSAVTGSCLEVSNDLRQLPEDRLALMGKAMSLSDPNRLVSCPDLLSTRAGDPPALWLAEGASDALLGVFNFGDAEAEIDLRRAIVRKPLGTATDVWTNERVTLGTSLKLGGRDSRLLRVAYR